MWSAFAGERSASRDWERRHRPELTSMLAGGRLSFDRAMADQSHKDVAAGRYVLHRFSTLSQAVVSAASPSFQATSVRLVCAC